MRDRIMKLNYSGKEYDCSVRIYDKEDAVLIHRAYSAWRYANDTYKALGHRAANIPEGLSETVFCLAMGSVNIITSPAGFPSSFDTYNVKRDARQELKATSVYNDLTSFSPKMRCDELYFLDFYVKGYWDGSFNIYQLDIDLVRNIRVNKTQLFKDQQAEGRRPRFSIRKNILLPYNIMPIYSGNVGVATKNIAISRVSNTMRLSKARIKKA